MKQSNLIFMHHILPTSVNVTTGKKSGDYYSVFYNAFARST